MLPIAPVTAADFLEPVQEMLYRFEIYDGAAWQNLCELGGSGGKNYLKSVSVSLGGAGLDTDPIAGTWSVVLDNENGIFHPQHPTSPWTNLLHVGREIRISVGGVFGGAEFYWQRIIGFMDAPKFNHGNKTAELSGLDYMRLLADTDLRDEYDVAESGSGSSGESGFYNQINGPTHWGSYDDLDTVESSKALGAELYDVADAAEIGAHEANNVANWDHSAYGDVYSVADAGAGSTWAIGAEHAGGLIGLPYAEIWNDNVCAITVGTEYFVEFYYKGQYIPPGGGSLDFTLYEEGTTNYFGGLTGLTATSWTQLGFYFTATKSCNLKIQLKIHARRRDDCVFRVDQISIKAVASFYNQRYILPALCNGPYFVTIDGEPIWQGFDEGSGWHYDESARKFWIDDAIPLEDGTNNMRVYFYTDQVLENVLADLLAYVGLYADRPSALIDMDYTPTGITIPRVFFETGSVALNAVQTICERANYRFYFEYDGKPNFNPAPACTGIDYTFTRAGHIRDISEFQDISQIRNRVIIEGIQQSMYPVSREDKTNDRFKGVAVDAVSVATYLEKTKTITNHLFQDQASVDAMAAAMVAESKDPKWYANLSLFACPVPLEMGDCIEWVLELEPTTNANEDSGAVRVPMTGLIRDIKIDDAQTEYKVELMEVTSGTAVPSASASASASASVEPETPETPSGGAEQTETYEDAAGNFGVPTGVTYMEIDGWGEGGNGGPPTGPTLGGGGGGGGGFSHVALSVTPLEILHYICGGGGSDTPTEVYRNWGLPGQTCILRAYHGLSATDQIGATGGQTAGAIGDVKYKGGNGSSAGAKAGRGGGSSAGTGANGNNAISCPGGTAPIGGGDGGDCGAEDFSGEPGYAPGGGGGGSGANLGGSPTGGQGGLGKITFRWWE